MSGIGQSVQQLQQDIQYELTTANQLLRLISNELQVIKDFTKSGGNFEKNIKQNASLIATLAKLQQVNIDNLPPIMRKETNQNRSHEGHDDNRNESVMDDSQ